jgi:hypothetical protein
MMRAGMFGLGFALAGDPPGSLTLADRVFWAAFCGDFDRAEVLIESYSQEAEGETAVPHRAREGDCAPPEGNRCSDFPYRYAWNRMDRKGQRCAVLVRGKMNSCLVEFEDGFQAVTSRNALRKATAWKAYNQPNLPSGPAPAAGPSFLPEISQSAIAETATGTTAENGNGDGASDCSARSAKVADHLED